MKRPRYYNLSANKGFTLVEILIVAALIALFSGMAIISTSYLVQQSKRKAAVADARTLASVLSISHMNLGFFPKLCYLSMPRAEIQNAEAPPKLQPDFDVMGYNSPSIHPNSVVDAWGGPYYPSPASRKSITGGKGYSAQMQMPTMQSDGTPKVVDWPADPWGNPYVVYLLYWTPVSPDNPSSQMKWITSPTVTPDCLAIVVSYGPDGMPGSPCDPKNLVTLRKQSEPFKLYRQVGEKFFALKPEEYGPPVNPINRITALKMAYGYLGQGVAYGIQDPGSDDIIVPIN